MPKPSPVPEVVSGSFDLGHDLGQLKTLSDSRGSLTELFREEWPQVPPLRQWNITRNEANVLRGMHVHWYHTDYFIVIEGEILLGLYDLRADSPSHGQSCLLRLQGDRLNYALFRPGVVHGFHSSDKSIIVCGLTHGWAMDDELGCRWDDPELNLDWPAFDNPMLSERDARPNSLRKLKSDFARIRHGS